MNVYEGIRLAVSLITLPLIIFGQYLLYKHVQATDLMWFIWYITIPLAFITGILNEWIRIKSK